MLKKIVIGVLILLALLIAGAVFVGSNLDSLIVAAVEKYGTEATKAETTLASVDLSPTEGTGALKGFKLGNPEGFSTDSAIKVGEVSIKLDTKTLMGDGPIVVREIVIDAPEVTYEVSNGGDSNLQRIQDNVKAFSEKLAGRSTEPVSEETQEAIKENKESRKLVIKQLIIKNGQVRLSHELLKGDDLLTAKLPEINLRNIGGDNNQGVTPAEVTQIVLNSITTMAARVGQSNLVKQLRQQGLDSLKGSVEESEIGKGVTKALDKLF